MLAAVIFFVFSIVVNMVLINMMMAIINMSFEEVKVDKHKFKSKFQLFEYIKRSARDELYKTGLPGKLILSKRKGLREVLFS